MTTQTGTVMFAAPHRGRFALKFDNGFAVLELIEAERLGVGDSVEYEADALGGRDFYNTSRGELLDVRLLGLALDEAATLRMLA